MNVGEIIEAHGGEKLWISLEALEAEISVKGALFSMKHLPVLNHAVVRASAREPVFRFLDYPRKGLTGELMGDKEVRILGSGGEVIESRANPRACFKGMRRFFYWDSLDFIYFGGYATWNYLTSPFIFLRDGFKFEELSPVQTKSGPWSRLRVSFPPDIPTHCNSQVFYFDKELLLRRLDYTAEVIGGWASAAHLCDDYRDFGGLKIPTRRRVLPLFKRSEPLPAPTLVAIDVHDVRLIKA